MKLPSYRDYRTVKGPAHVLYGTFAKHTDKFQSTMSFLHISDLDSEDQTDRLTKVRSMLDHLNSTCELLYQPYEHIAID